MRYSANKVEQRSTSAAGESPWGCTGGQTTRNPLDGRTFNFYNKWIFGQVAVNKLYDIGYIPEDQYSKKGSTAEDSKFDNRLMMDLSRQFRQPLAAVSANADKCYDRINHIIMSLLLLAIGGDEGSINAMMTPIQQMRFFQRTGRGDLNTFMGG